ncbi:MAG: hypothetical protein HMLIMOIP_002567 [Candidatus Nitrosomirales archaeon]|jgi:hypothetical protein
MTWKYIESKKVKHYFYAPSRTVTACGVSIVWYASPKEQWQYDKKGLDARRPCKRCLKMAEKEKEDVRQKEG